jgi:hypothetical protein
MSWFSTKKWPKYTHILMNLEVDLEDHPDRFLLIESTNSGVHFSTFESIMQCDNVCLTTVDITRAQWDRVRIGLAKQLGKKYDDLFDIMDNTHVTCVEMCWDAFDELDDRRIILPSLVRKIAIQRHLVPEDFLHGNEFILVYETKH